MRSRLRTALVSGIAALGVGVAVLVSVTPAHAATLCDQFATVVSGNYVIMNNRWGTSATQCINTTSSGFSITQQDGTGNLSGAPTAYPAIYLGCHYSNCSPGFSPKQINSFSNANSSISLSYPGSGTWDAAYDIWLNADTNVSGVQDTEIMIWLNHQGSIQPVGGQSGSANVGGRSWTVWTGNNGQNNVVSYVSSSAIGSYSFNVRDFIMDTLSRGSQYGNTSWYLTSIQAGFEPWIGGVGLTVNSFSASVGGGTPTTAPPTTGGGQSGTCTATYNQTGMWQGGFQAEVTVRNNGSSTLNGWTVRLGLASGQSIQNLWNGVNSGTSGSITVKNQSYNGTIGANGTTTFGYVANGNSASTPTLSCTSP